MKARKLVEENGSFGPDELTVLRDALEDAWSFIEGYFDGEQLRNDSHSDDGAFLGVACGPMAQAISYQR